MCYVSYPSLFLHLCRLGVIHPTPRTPTIPTTPTLSLNFLFFLFFGGVTRSSPSLFIIFYYYFHHTFKVVYLPIYLRSAALLFPFCVVIRFSVKTRLERK